MFVFETDMCHCYCFISNVHIKITKMQAYSPARFEGTVDSRDEGNDTSSIPNPYEIPAFHGGRYDPSSVPRNMGTDVSRPATRSEIMEHAETVNVLFRKPGQYDERNEALADGRPTFDKEDTGMLFQPLSFPYQRNDWRLEGTQQDTRQLRRNVMSSADCIDRNLFK